MTRRRVGVLSTIFAFMMTFVLSEVFAAELERDGLRLSSFIVKNILRPIFGPNGIQIYPTYVPFYNADNGSTDVGGATGKKKKRKGVVVTEEGALVFSVQNAQLVWELYQRNPAAFEAGGCRPEKETNFEEAYEFKVFALARLAAKHVSQSDHSFDTIICATNGEAYLDDKGELHFWCPRMGCLWVAYFFRDGHWRLAFENGDEGGGCTSIVVLATITNGMRDLLCYAFGNSIQRWDGSRYRFIG